MADDTISKIKLRLNNNSKLKQSKSKMLAALNNRMSATDYSPCNDFFANCCNCCNNCNCCNCLSGFFLTVSGWSNDNCGDCESFNGTWYVPIVVEPYTDPFDAVCPKHGTYSFEFLTCNKHLMTLTWTLTCVHGLLQLEIIQEIINQDNETVDILSGIIPSIDCDDFSDIILPENYTRIGIECDPSGATLSFVPVFGGPDAPTECQCCRPERCEAEEPGCLNPYPTTLTFNFTDNCSGPSTVTLTRVTDFGMGLCWTGLYDVVCIECEYGYSIGVMLCCNGGEWSLFFFPVNIFDSIVWDNLFEGYGTDPDSEHLMYLDNCDPLSFHSNEGFCKTATVNCPGPISALYCVYSFTITE